jgi:hypothetical protein
MYGAIQKLNRIKPIFNFINLVFTVELLYEELVKQFSQF